MRTVALRALACAAAFTLLAAQAQAVTVNFGPQSTFSSAERIAFDVPIAAGLASDVQVTLQVTGSFAGQNPSLIVSVGQSAGGEPMTFQGDIDYALDDSGCGTATVTGVVAQDDVAAVLVGGSVPVAFQFSGFGEACVEGGPVATVSGSISFEVEEDEGDGEVEPVEDPAEETLAEQVAQATKSAAQNLTTSRANLAIANLPSFSVRLGGGGGGTAFSGIGSDANGAFSFSTSLAALKRAAAQEKQGATAAAFGAENGGGAIDVWIGGSYTYYETEFGSSSSEGDIGIIQGGVDYRVSDRFLLGLFAMGDLLDGESNDDTGSSGLGFLAGPYAVLGLTENIQLEGVAAFGMAFNEIDAASAASVDYDSERVLLSARLSGDWRHEGWTFTPSTRVTYYAEHQEAFKDGLGGDVPENTTELGQVRFGPEIGYELALESGGALRPFAGVEGVWSFRQDDQTVSGSTIASDDLSASLSLGLDASIGSASLRAAGRVDGLGTSQFESFTGEFQLRLPLN